MNKFLSSKASEEEYKASLYSGLFKNFDYFPGFESTRIDLVLTSKITGQHLLWAEVKNEKVNWVEMLTQLVLTIYKPYFGGEVVPPPYVAVIDSGHFWAFKTADLVGILARNDIDWRATPSNYKADAFKYLCKLLGEKITPFRDFNLEDSADLKQLRKFIKEVLELGSDSTKIDIQLANVNHVFNKWSENVLKKIALSTKDWQELAKVQLYPVDFFLADLLFCSETDYTTKEDLSVIQTGKFYMLAADRAGLLKLKEQFYRIKTTDDWKVYKAFWGCYKRPPEETEGSLILARRDLLVPKDVRERKGAFYTPKIWVDKAHEYLAKALGEDWQDEYYVYDCAAGTGNLLMGLKPEMRGRIFASTLDQPDVEIMKTETKPTFESNIFQFDFLNDDFIRQSKGGKVPDTLMDILEDAEKRKKLVFLINPPYNTAGSGDTAEKRQGKEGGVVSKVKGKYGDKLGMLQKELYTQFLIRIYFEFLGCILAEFTTLKLIQSTTAKKFRESFKAVLLDMFVVNMATFENVSGGCPIGFKVWDTSEIRFYTTFRADVFIPYKGGSRSIGYKDVSLPPQRRQEQIVYWLKNRGSMVVGIEMGILHEKGGNTRQGDFITIESLGSQYNAGSKNKIIGTLGLEVACVFFAVRESEQPEIMAYYEEFWNPSFDPLLDRGFVKDSVIFSLFHPKNRISEVLGDNHWIPFSEHLMGIKTAPYKHHTMLNYFKRLDIPNSLSFEANRVYEVAFKIFEYYHSYGSVSPCGQFQYNVDAALYDIRKFFQGVNTKGRMNPSSKDDYYQGLIKDLRAALKDLRDVRISPKVYQYGFLK